MNKFKIWTEIKFINKQELITVFYQDYNDESKTFNSAFPIKDNDLLTVIDNLKFIIENIILQAHPPITMEMECKREIKKLQLELDHQEKLLKILNQEKL